MDWSQIGKGVHQGCILSPCLFKLYAEYIMQNARLDDSQAGIKIAGRKINNLRYADDTSLMVESKEELKGFLMRVKDESEKAGLKFKEVRSWHLVPLGKVGTVTDFIFLGSNIIADSDCTHEIKGCFLLERKAMTNPDSRLKSRITLLKMVCICQNFSFPVVVCGYESWAKKRLRAQELMLSNCGAEEGSREFLGQQGDQIS